MVETLKEFAVFGVEHSVQAGVYGLVFVLVMFCLVALVALLFPPECPRCGSTKLRRLGDSMDSGLDVQCDECGNLTL